MSDLPLPEPIRTDKPLDIQHDTDPAEDHGDARRIPHLGHALLFFSLAATFVLILQLVVVVALHAFTPEAAKQHLLALAGAMVGAYALTFAVAIPVFPFLWRRSFFDGVHWNWRAVRLRWWKLLLMGCILSIIAQLLEHFVKTPVETDLTMLLKTARAAWLTVIFGLVAAPFTEEIAFRGFLLPAFAIAYDWMALKRTPAGYQHWRSTANISREGYCFGAIVSSLGFMSLHGTQLHWAGGPLAVLFVMSLAFSAVRVVTKSVAASTLVHIAYDGLIFLEVIWATGGFRHLDKL